MSTESLSAARVVPPTSAAAGRDGDTRVRGAAPVLEVFASIQGEGAFVGEPHTFLRLRGCPLRCRWCDTPGSWGVAASPTARVVARLDGLDGNCAEVRREPAWATGFQALCWIAAAEGPWPRTISITGGEPLLWPDFVLDLRRLAGERRLHLETAGAHPAALARVLDAVDHVSLDLKLVSTLDAPEEVAAAGEVEPSPRTADEWRDVRRRVLALVRGRDACAKIVLAGGVEPDELGELLADVAELAPGLTVFLQPVTPAGGVVAPPRAELDAALAAAFERELRVRVVPQVHRALGVE